MITRLLRYKVLNFRSIEESDWIEIGDNTCLVGTNEAGKTNLLIALWKLNPANGESIRPLPDYPRHLYSKYKADGHSEDVFIKADFELDEVLQKEIASSLLCSQEQVRVALVERLYNGKYYISLPYSQINFYSLKLLQELIQKFTQELEQNEFYYKEIDVIKEKIQILLNELVPKEIGEVVYKQDIENIVLKINEFTSSELGKKKNLPALFDSEILIPLYKILDAFNGKPIETTEEIRQAILSKIPKFVYYSDYGNLDSEIFLPRVIEDFDRTDLPESARAKVRTLDVLFKYVNLSPREIYELGNDRKTIIKHVDAYGNVKSTQEVDLSPEEIMTWAEKKKERSVLLKSASSELTQNFKKWWQQGNYIFSFEADGSHFRINVSDDLRPESIELEGRSRGLQWFFSFFLVFLVETKEEHSNTVLLLDEPGLSLHPMAQFDLAKFFRKLADDNQLIYTSHSPFLVDMDNLANVKAVYIDTSNGRTRVSDNLRYNEIDAEKSIYPIHAALGLTVSETLLLGCLPILVEGPSDQIYLSMIKRYLIGKGLIQDTRELVFIPTGGVRGMAPITKLLSSRDNDLPYVLLDSDKMGREYLDVLRKGLYKDQHQRLLEISTFLGDKEYEIEDLMPTEPIVSLVDRVYRGNGYFADHYINSEPVVDQIEGWAKKNGVILAKGWKVDFAREAINKFDKMTKNLSKELETTWTKLFQAILVKTQP